MSKKVTFVVGLVAVCVGLHMAFGLWIALVAGGFVLIVGPPPGP